MTQHYEGSVYRFMSKPNREEDIQDEETGQEDEEANEQEPGFAFRQGSFKSFKAGNAVNSWR